MNKKYALAIMILAFFMFKLHADDYDQIILAYRNGTLSQLNKQRSIQIVQNHQQTLKDQTGTIGATIGSVITKIMSAGVFLGSMIVAGAGAVFGYMANEFLNLPQNRLVTRLGSGPGASYFEWLKHGYGVDKSLITSGKVAYTENVFLPTQHPNDQQFMTFGKAVPPLLGGSIIGLFVARYLWNRSNTLKNQIALDQAILDALRLQN